MIDRRNLLLGSAPLALFLAAEPSLAADAESAQRLERVRALWQQHRRRADRIREGVLRAAGPAADVATIDVIAEGMAWAGVMSTCAQQTTRDLCHPAFQAALREASVALGDTVKVLGEVLAGVAAAGIDDAHLLASQEAVTRALDTTDEDPEGMVRLRGAAARLVDDLRRDGSAAVIRAQRRRLAQLSRVAEEVAERGEEAIASHDPALRAEVDEGTGRWQGHAAPLEEERAPLGPGAIAGMLALGLVVVGGVLVFALGTFATLANCACAGIPLMLLAIGVIALAGLGIHRILHPVSRLVVAQVVGPDWTRPTLPLDGWRTARVWGTGLIQDAATAWRSDARGVGLHFAGAGAPSPQGRFGALLGRTPAPAPGRYDMFYAMNAEISSSVAPLIEFAINVAPGTVLKGPGYQVHFRPLS